MNFEQMKQNIWYKNARGQGKYMKIQWTTARGRLHFILIGQNGAIVPNSCKDVFTNPKLPKIEVR